MIRDAKGRKWFLRFKHYREGWHWDARCEGNGQSSATPFKTKALAEEDARQQIQNSDAIALGAEYFHRLRERGSECQLTAADFKAIKQAGSKHPK